MRKNWNSNWIRCTYLARVVYPEGFPTISQAKRTVNMAEGITVALFYKYVPIDCVADVAANQKSTCLKLGLTGRVRLAHEGVNGLIAGKLSALQQ